MGSGGRFAKAPPTKLSFSTEKRVSRVAVGSGGEPMLLHPRDFSFQQMDALGQFILRIGAEVFACEQARRIAFRLGTVVQIHRWALSRAARLLSMAALATPTASQGKCRPNDADDTRNHDGRGL